MVQNILVTYATRTGSTSEVAAVIAKTLSVTGTHVDLIPMQEVTDIGPYQAVVAGSAIQDRQWLPEALEFIRTHQTVLNQKPFALFALCMTLAMKNGESYRPQISAWLAPVHGMVRPVSEGFFAGILDISKIPSFGDRLKFHLSVLFGVWSQGDHRDWNAIREWATGLTAKLI